MSRQPTNKVTTSLPRAGLSQGFTLIELIISTAVILMVLAVTLPAFSAFQRKQNLITASQLVRDAILDAQNYALAPRNEKINGADYYRVVLLPDLAGDSAGFQLEEQTYNDPVRKTIDSSSPAWQIIKGPIQLPYHIRFCSSVANLPAANLGPTGGLIYSISQLGKLVMPGVNGPTPLTGTITIPIQQKGSAREVQTLSIQTETNRIDNNGGGTCS